MTNKEINQMIIIIIMIRSIIIMRSIMTKIKEISFYFIIFINFLKYLVYLNMSLL